MGLLLIIAGINQECLIYADEKTIVLYDLLKQEESMRRHFPEKMKDLFKNEVKLTDIDMFYLSENSGILLSTSDGKLLDYSFKKNAANR